MFAPVIITVLPVNGIGLTHFPVVNLIYNLIRIKMIKIKDRMTNNIFSERLWIVCAVGDLIKLF